MFAGKSKAVTKLKNHCCELLPSSIDSCIGEQSIPSGPLVAEEKYFSSPTLKSLYCNYIYLHFVDSSTAHSAAMVQISAEYVPDLIPVYKIKPV